MAQDGTQNDREKALREIFAGIDDGMRSVIDPLITETVYLEGELAALRELPKIRIHPSDHQRQQTTPAAKLYKELLQQYTNCVKVLTTVLRREAPEEESPLRAWLEGRRKQDAGA